jgi:hypothetical protein
MGLLNRRHQNQDPRVISVKFPAKCQETGKTLKKGERALFYPNDKSLFSLDSKEYSSFLSWQADIQNGFDY